MFSYAFQYSDRRSNGTRSGLSHTIFHLNVKGDDHVGYLLGRASSEKADGQASLKNVRCPRHWRRIQGPCPSQRGAAVIVYTDRLASASTGLLSATALGKKTNVPVRIVKTGKIRANATDYRVRIRPVIAGYSVGTIEGSGTTGLIVAPTGAPATRYLLATTMSSIPPIQTIGRLQFSQAEPMGGRLLRIV